MRVACLLNKTGWWPLLLLGCTVTPPPERLPILGPMEVVSQADGTTDTLFTPYPWFAFEDQQGLMITPDSLENQVLLVDFFFTSCPTICKDLLSSLRQVYQQFGNDPALRILSHSVDPEYDTPEVLAAYAEAAGVKNRNWLFLRGDADEIYRIAKLAYLSYAMPDASAPGGFMHSGHLILLDRDKKIRGVYDGTEKAELSRLLRELHVLLAE